MKRHLMTAVVGLALWSGGNAALGNETHIAKLRAHPEILRNLAFQGVIRSSRNECAAVTHSFIRGALPDGTVLVTARCLDGDDYVIMESGMEKGSRILTCDQSKIIFMQNGIVDNCWTPLLE